MLLFLFASALFSRAVQASAFPSLTNFGNSTTVAPSGAVVTGCPNDCNRHESGLNYVSWSQMSITATYTAETLLYVVNNRTNSTRTSTIKNTEINFANISTPTSTNSAGTVTASFSLTDGNIVTAAYPTNVYEDYPSTYSFCGTLPTIIRGTPTCLRNPCTTGSVTDSQAGIYTFPSHPPLPVTTQTDADLNQDPRGWTYVAMVNNDCEDENLIKPMFPDLGFWSCTLSATCVAPAMALNTALYLTVTSTSHEAGTPSPQAVSAPPSSLATDTPQPPTSTPIANPPAPNDGNPLAAAALTPENALAPTSTTPPPPATNTPPPPTSIPVPLIAVQPESALAPANTSPTPPAITSLPPHAAANTPAANTPPPNQQASSNAPAPNQQAPKAANDSPQQPAPAANPPWATIVPIAVTSTDEPGNTVVSTAPVAAIPVLHSTTNAQGSVAVSTSFSQLTPNAPLTLVPQTVTSTNAQGSVITTTSHAAAIAIPITTTNAQGHTAVSTSTSLSPVATNAAPSPIAFSPTPITTTNAQGSTTVSTATAAIIPIATTTTNAHGQIVVSTSLSTAAATATANIVVSSTNAQGSMVSSTSQVPAVVLTTTNFQGSEVVTTSPIVPVTTQAPVLTVANQVVTANSQEQYIIGSQTLTAGGAITVSGTKVSLAPGDTQVVVGTSTEGLGGLITAGLGNGPNGAGSVQAFTGGVKGRHVPFELWLEAMIVVAGVGMATGL